MGMDMTLLLCNEKGESVLPKIMVVVVFLFVLQIKLYEIASIFRHPAIMNEFTVSLFNQSAVGEGGME